MPRNGSGSYSLPEAAFIPNTAISSAAVNSDFSDIATALTGSLARDGQGGMTAVLPLANTGFVYLNDPNTGMRRTAADTQAISSGGVDTITITSTGVSIAGTLAVSGAFTIGGAPLLPVGLGPLPWSGLTAPSKWLFCYGQTLLRADYPDLWTFIAAEIAAGNTLFTNGNGSTTFTMPDMRGRIPAGKDNMGGVAAGVLTAAGNGFGAQGGDPTILGSNGGTQNLALSLAQLPTGITSPVTVTSNTSNLVSASSQPSLISYQVGGTLTVTFPNPGTYVATSAVTSSGTATSDNTSGTAHPIVQPTVITNYIIYAGA